MFELSIEKYLGTHCCPNTIFEALQSEEGKTLDITSIRLEVLFEGLEMKELKVEEHQVQHFQC